MVLFRDDLDFIITDILTVARFPNQLDKTWKVKGRDFHCIAFRLGGNDMHLINGKTVDFRENTVLFLHKEQDYIVKTHELGECIAVHFMVLNDFDLESGLLSIKDADIIKSLFIKMDKEWFYKKGPYLLVCRSLLYDIFSLLARSTNQRYYQKNKAEQIQTAMAYIKSHYSDPSLSIKSLSGLLNMSEQYFRLIFKDINMISPQKYIISIRVSIAKDMLRTSYHRVNEIAKMVGFSDIYYFSKVFKKETGTAPTSFRKVNQA